MGPPIFSEISVAKVKSLDDVELLTVFASITRLQRWDAAGAARHRDAAQEDVASIGGPAVGCQPP